MIKITFIVHRKSGTSREDFSRYWQDVHQPICKRIPGLRKYVQNHARPSPDGVEPSYDGFAEVWFDDLAAFEAGMSSPEGEATAADLPNFIDVEGQEILFVDEHMVVGGDA